MLFRDLPGIMTHVCVFDRESTDEAATLVQSNASVVNVLFRLFWEAAWPKDPWSAAAAKEPERRKSFAEATENVYRAMIVFPESRDDLRQAILPLVDEMNGQGLKCSIEPVKPEEVTLQGDKLGLIQARLFKIVGHLLLHDIALSEPIVSAILEQARFMSRGILLQRVGLFRKEYHIGFLHHGDRDDLLQRIRTRQSRYAKISELLAAMHATADGKNINLM